MNSNLKHAGPPAGLIRPLLLVGALAVAAGCGRPATPDKGKVAAAPAAAPVAAVTPEALQAGDEESLVDIMAPTVPEGSDSQLKSVSERERNLVRQVLAIDQQIDLLIQDQTTSDPQARELHQQMTAAREAYQRHVQAIPEVAHLAGQKDLLRKQLNEARALRLKMTGEK